MKVIGTNNEKTIKYRQLHPEGRNNGSYFYAKEIEDNILPELEDIDLTVITTGASLFNKYELPKDLVVVCHDNRNPLQSYRSLLGRNYLWVCSKPSTVKIMESVNELAVYTHLSIDTEYVRQFRVAEKTGDIAFVGNAWGFKREYLESLPKSVVQLSGLEREDLLQEMAKFKRVIAEGRCLMEAQVLGAKTEVPVYQNGLESVYVEALDNRATIPDWRRELEAYVEAIKKRR